MLEYQMSVWREYPFAVRENLEIVVVDDCSPVGLRAEEVIKKNIERFGNFDFPFRLVRILVDVAWNECGAKNLGVIAARHGWILITDIDHIVSAAILQEVQSKKLDAETIYSFTRIRHQSKEANNPHKETMLISTGKFFKVGTFDESYCGHYSFCVREYFDRLSYVNTPKERVEIPLERVDDLIVPDAKVHGLIRKDGRDDAAYEDIRDWKRGKNIGIESLKLPWKEIEL